MTDRHPYQPADRDATIGGMITGGVIGLAVAALIIATYIALAPMFSSPPSY